MAAPDLGIVVQLELARLAPQQLLGDVAAQQLAAPARFGPGPGQLGRHGVEGRDELRSPDLVGADARHHRIVVAGALRLAGGAERHPGAHRRLGRVVAAEPLEAVHDAGAELVGQLAGAEALGLVEPAQGLLVAAGLEQGGAEAVGDAGAIRGRAVGRLEVSGPLPGRLVEGAGGLQLGCHLAPHGGVGGGGCLVGSQPERDRDGGDQHQVRHQQRVEAGHARGRRGRDGWLTQLHGLLSGAARGRGSSAPGRRRSPRRRPAARPRRRRPRGTAPGAGHGRRGPGGGSRR